jgi:prepilin-type processing-associated H-X9-DG protein
LKRIAATCVISLACLFGSTARAQPLADRVPDDAIFYLGWAGANTLGDAYGTSHLKAILDETRARDLFGKYLSELEAKVLKNEPEATEPFRLLRTLGAPMWNYPAAFYVGTPDFSNPDQPQFHVAMLSQAGADASKLSDEINALLAKAPKSPVPIQAVAAGDVLVFAIGYESPEKALAEVSKSLSTSATFSSALKQVSANPVSIAFVNAEAIIATAESAIEKQDMEAKAKLSTFLDASGLRGAKALIATGGFDGKDWVDQCFLAVPGERTGLFASVPTGPADATLMKAVPADATFFASTRFDIAKFVKSLRDSVGKADEQGLQYFNMGLNALQQALGTNVLENVLEPLGADWVIYNSPRTGSSLLGMVVANKLDDPDKFKKAMNTASLNLTNWINLGIRKSANGGPGADLFQVHTATTKIGDVDVNYFALPIVAPAWAIKDGKLFIGLYPQSVGAAARVSAKGGPSILENEKYQSLLKRLGNASPESSTFLDLETSAKYGSMYPQIMLLARYAGIGDLFGLTLPEPLLPPIDVMLDHLSPAGSVSWSDATGYHKKSVTPFPGANLVSEQGAMMAVGVGGASLGTSILLPSLNRARETANRVKSASNLKQIGLGMMLYANENRGKYPADFGELIRTQDLVAEVFTSPRTQTSLPPDLNTPDKAAAFVVEQSDYVYLGAGMNNSAPAESILAYEKPDGLDDGINILFGDGHVEFVHMGHALEMIEAAKAGQPAGGGAPNGL